MWAILQQILVCQTLGDKMLSFEFDIVQLVVSVTLESPVACNVESPPYCHHFSSHRWLLCGRTFIYLQCKASPKASHKSTGWHNVLFDKYCCFFNYVMDFKCCLIRSFFNLSFCFVYTFFNFLLVDLHIALWLTI